MLDFVLPLRLSPDKARILQRALQPHIDKSVEVENGFLRVCREDFEGKALVRIVIKNMPMDTLNDVCDAIDLIK